MDLIREIVDIYDNYEFDHRSARGQLPSPDPHRRGRARMGADICTCPTAVIDSALQRIR